MYQNGISLPASKKPLCLFASLLSYLFASLLSYLFASLPQKSLFASKLFASLPPCLFASTNRLIASNKKLTSNGKRKNRK